MIAKRLIAVTVVCILGFISVIGGLLPRFFVDAVSGKYQFWYLTWHAFSMVVLFTFMLGMWRMRRWGTVVYIIGMAFNFGMNFGRGSFPGMLYRSPGYVIVPLIYVAVGIYYYRDMKWSA